MISQCSLSNLHLDIMITSPQLRGCRKNTPYNFHENIENKPKLRNSYVYSSQLPKKVQSSFTGRSHTQHQTRQGLTQQQQQPSRNFVIKTQHVNKQYNNQALNNLFNLDSRPNDGMVKYCIQGLQTEKLRQIQLPHFSTSTKRMKEALEAKMNSAAVEDYQTYIMKDLSQIPIKECSPALISAIVQSQVKSKMRDVPPLQQCQEGPAFLCQPFSPKSGIKKDGKFLKKQFSLHTKNFNKNQNQFFGLQGSGGQQNLHKQSQLMFEIPQLDLQQIQRQQAAKRSQTANNGAQTPRSMERKIDSRQWISLRQEVNQLLSEKKIQKVTSIENSQMNIAANISSPQLKRSQSNFTDRIFQLNNKYFEQKVNNCLKSRVKQDSSHQQHQNNQTDSHINHKLILKVNTSYSFENDDDNNNGENGQSNIQHNTEQMQIDVQPTIQPAIQQQQQQQQTTVKKQPIFQQLQPIDQKQYINQQQEDQQHNKKSPLEIETLLLQTDKDEGQTPNNQQGQPWNYIKEKQKKVPTPHYMVNLFCMNQLKANINSPSKDDKKKFKKFYEDVNNKLETMKMKKIQEEQAASMVNGINIKKISYQPLCMINNPKKEMVSAVRDHHLVKDKQLDIMEKYLLEQQNATAHNKEIELRQQKETRELSKQYKFSAKFLLKEEYDPEVISKQQRESEKLLLDMEQQEEAILKMKSDHNIKLADRRKQLMVKVKRNLLIAISMLRRLNLETSEILENNLFVQISYQQPNSKRFFEVIKQQDVEEVQLMVTFCKYLIYDYDLLLQSPLHLAVKRGNSKICMILINSGADIDAKDKFQRTPLFFAYRNRDETIIELLLKAGAQPWSTIGNNDFSSYLDQLSEGIQILLRRAKHVHLGILMTKYSEREKFWEKNKFFITIDKKIH